HDIEAQTHRQAEGHGLGERTLDEQRPQDETVQEQQQQEHPQPFQIRQAASQRGQTQQRHQPSRLQGGLAEQEGHGEDGHQAQDLRPDIQPVEYGVGLSIEKEFHHAIRKQASSSSSVRSVLP